MIGFCFSLTTQGRWGKSRAGGTALSFDPWFLSLRQKWLLCLPAGWGKQYQGKASVIVLTVRPACGTLFLLIAVGQR